MPQVRTFAGLIWQVRGFTLPYMAGARLHSSLYGRCAASLFEGIGAAGDGGVPLDAVMCQLGLQPIPQESGEW